MTERRVGFDRWEAIDGTENTAGAQSAHAQSHSTKGCVMLTDAQAYPDPKLVTRSVRNARESWMRTYQRVVTHCID